MTDLDITAIRERLQRLRKVYFPWSPEDSQEACDLIRDLLEGVESSRAVVERLQGENEALREQAKAKRDAKRRHMNELAEANTALHAENTRLQGELDAQETEDQWVPIHVSGAEWAGRSFEDASQALLDYPRDWTFTGEESGGPDGLVGLRQERRRKAGPWLPVPTDGAEN